MRDGNYEAKMKALIVYTNLNLAKIQLQGTIAIGASCKEGELDINNTDKKVFTTTDSKPTLTPLELRKSISGFCTLYGKHSRADLASWVQQYTRTQENPYHYLGGYQLKGKYDINRKTW